MQSYGVTPLNNPPNIRDIARLAWRYSRVAVFSSGCILGWLYSRLAETRSALM